MYITFDIGGTKMRVGASVDLKSFICDPKIIPTPREFDEGINTLETIVLNMTKGAKVKAVAGGIAGIMNEEKTELSYSPNRKLRGWEKRPLKGELAKRLGCNVDIANDTAVVGLGEAHRGAGIGYNIVTYITVSTGVGGTRIVDGRIDRRIYGFEPGHQTIDIDNSVWEGSASGQLEDLISGDALEKRFGMKPYEIEDDDLWERQLPDLLACGLANTIMHWSPDVVVLGGSMIIGKPAISIRSTKEALTKILTMYPKLPEIKKAECGDLGGLYGGLALIKQRI